MNKYRFTIEQTYSMSHTLTDYIHPALVSFKEVVSGLESVFAVPEIVVTENPGKSIEECNEIWHNIMDEMIFSFSKKPEDFTEADIKRRDVGRLLFIKHFNDLWW